MNNACRYYCASSITLLRACRRAACSPLANYSRLGTMRCTSVCVLACLKQVACARRERERETEALALYRARARQPAEHLTLIPISSRPPWIYMYIHTYESARPVGQGIPTCQRNSRLAICSAGPLFYWSTHARPKLVT